MSKLILGITVGLMTALFVAQTAMIGNSIDNSPHFTNAQISAARANWDKNHTLK